MKISDARNDILLRREAAAELFEHRVRFIAEIIPSGQQRTYRISRVDLNVLVLMEGVNGVWSPQKRFFARTRYWRTALTT